MPSSGARRDARDRGQNNTAHAAAPLSRTSNSHAHNTQVRGRVHNSIKNTTQPAAHTTTHSDCTRRRAIRAYAHSTPGSKTPHRLDTHTKTHTQPREPSARRHSLSAVPRGAAASDVRAAHSGELLVGEVDGVLVGHALRVQRGDLVRLYGLELEAVRLVRVGGRVRVRGSGFGVRVSGSGQGLGVRVRG